MDRSAPPTCAGPTDTNQFSPTFHRPHSRAHETAQNVELVRNAGIPAPRYELVADLGDEVAIVRELLPGRLPRRIDVNLIEQMLAVNDRLYGLSSGVTGIAAVPLYLTEKRSWILHPRNLAGLQPTLPPAPGLDTRGRSLARDAPRTREHRVIEMFVPRWVVS